MTTKEQKRRWYEEHRESEISRVKKYRLDHPEWDKEVNLSKNRSDFNKSWRQRNPEKAQALAKRTTFNRKLKKYNLTPEQFQAMQTKQEGKCAVCEIVPPDGLVIDHNHNTNQVRELLCNRCNPAVGMLLENPNIARKLISYLEKHSS